MGEHLIFFDDKCPFCHKAIRHVIEIDIHKHFVFSPLDGAMAKELLIGPQKGLARANSLVVVENYDSTRRQFWSRSHALLRVYWLVDNGWGIVGCLSFMPQAMGDFFYRWVAEHRHQFKLHMPENPVPDERWVP